MRQSGNANIEGEGKPPPPPPPLPPYQHGSTLQVPSFNMGPRLIRPSEHAAVYKAMSGDVERLAPRASIILPHLASTEKQFFELVHAGDESGVSNFLANNQPFNINCVNFQGVSALLVAVTDKNESMVELLLSQPGIEVGDCVLHAVKDNEIKILELLLNHLHTYSPQLEFVGVTHSTDFSDYMTPLILAAQCGHFEIIEMLIERGHSISKPHSPKCRCSECIAHLERDDLLHGETLRLNLYRAVTNPAYICHSTHDPILVAFQLSHELRQCSAVVPEFRAAYAELAEEVSTFAVDLIASCRSTTEMEIILTQTAGLHKTHFMFPRLVLALDLKQKTFVAHPNTQQLVEAAWTGDWHAYRLMPTLGRFVYPLYRILLLPFITVMCLVYPSHGLVAHYRLPLNKMINHLATYIIFLLLIFLESNIDKTGQKRMPPNSGLEPVILVFVIGHIWNTIRMFLVQGFFRYFKALWNWHAVITNLFFVLTFIFWGAAYFDAKNNDQVDLERKYWNNLDPVLIAEGTFAVAVLLSFFKLMFFCRLSYYLGPLQISLGKMCSDMAKYITIFIVIVIAYTCSMCRFYQYYDGMVQIDDAGMKTQQVSSFIDFTTTLKTFFWAVLGMAALESADVIIENLPGKTENTTIVNKHEFTEAVGYIAFATYSVLMTLMLINMLVATMCNTFQRVIDNLDVEWTFGKTDFYLEYIMQSTLPSPLNLIPTQLGLNLMRQVLVAKKGDALNEERKMNEYQALMSQLVQRYFREKDENGSASEMEQLKNEIADLKQTIKDLMH